MKENQRLIITLAVAVLAIALIVLVSFIGGKKGEEVVTRVYDALNGEKTELIMIGSPTCGWCEKLKPVLDEYKEKYKFDYIYVNINEMSQKQTDKISSLLQITKLGTPYLVVVGKGKVIDTQPEYLAEEDLFKFLQDNKFIGKDEKLPLDYITTAVDYKKVIEAKEKSVVVIAQTGCGACISAHPALNQIAEEYKVPIHYINMTNLTQDDQKIVTSSFDVFSGEWGTPLMLVVQDDKVVDMSKGFISKDTYITFLTKNGLIKE